jgi:HAD superfamily hydrolase (TIGR01509 family)
MASMAIGFDLDGTLVDSLDLTAEWLTRAATKALGQPVSESLVRSHFGKPEPEILRDLLKDPVAETAFFHYQEILRAECGKMNIFPGVLQTLNELRQREIPLAVFSSRGAWGTDELLNALELRDFFSFVLTGDQVEKVKPDPEGIYKLCEVLKVDPGSFLYIGDSADDVRAAQAAGARGVQCLWARGVQPFGSDHLRSFGELLSLLPKS